MKFVALGDIVDKVIDYRGKTPKKLGGDWSKSGYPALSAKNIKTREIVNLESIRFVDKNIYSKWMKEEIKRGDILLTSEAPFGQVYYWDSDEKIVLSQRLFGIRLKQNVNSKFVYQYMTSSQFQGELESRATGTTVMGIRQPELLKCKVAIPEMSAQNKIADILFSLDNKICVNNCLIQRLEDLAICYVREIISSANEGGSNISEYAFLNPDRKIKKGHVARYIGMASLSTTRAFPLDWEFKEYSGGAKFVNGDTLLARITPCLENNKGAFIDLLDENEVAFGSTEYIVFCSKGILPNEFIYCLTKTKEFREFAIKRLNGSSGRQRVSANDLAMYPLPLFSQADIEKMKKNLPPLFSLVNNLGYQNRVISNLRDCLLRKLMSGELKLNK